MDSKEELSLESFVGKTMWSFPEVVYNIKPGIGHVGDSSLTGVIRNTWK